jgi:myo-inositol-1-phosphate synthase
MSNKIEKFKLSEQEEEYLLIYHEYFVLSWDWTEICKFHNCSKAKVSKAIHWVIDNKLNIPAKCLIKGAIDAINVRMKKTKELYDAEVSKKRYRDNMFIVSLMKEMREDEKTLYKLNEIYKEDDGTGNNLNAGQVLALIKKASDMDK